MSNPLEIGMTSPAPPNPDAGTNALQQGAAPQQQQQAPAAPNSAQTVAALRHFNAIQDELNVLLKNPGLGKSDIKGAAIDGVSKLVAQRIMKPAEAVIELSKFPSEPIQQRKYVQQQMMQTVQAEHAVIAHHGAGFAGGGPEPTPSADDHFEHMSQLHANYGGKR